MKFLDGLLPYEIVLLGLGVLLFLVLLVLLIYSVVSKRPTTSVTALFVLPVLMIGFPSIQSFKFSGMEVDVVKTAENASKNPNDPTAQKAFETAADKLDTRRITDPELTKTITDARLKIAEAQISAGQQDKAIANVNSALQLNPHAEMALQLKQKLRIERLPQ